MFNIISPRTAYRPVFPAEWTDLLAAAQADDCLILWDEHVDWRGQVLSQEHVD